MTARSGDPAAVLVTEYRRLWRECNRRRGPEDDDPYDETFDRLVDAVGRDARKIVRRLIATPANTGTGLAGMASLIADQNLDDDLVAPLVKAVQRSIRALIAD